MKLLQNMTGLSEGKDLSELPHDVFSDIKNNIRKGAADLEQDWANALHVVHKSYEVEGVQRPDPSMGAAWKQYEEAIIYSVQQLKKYRGMDGDWRMSAAMVHEAYERKIKFRVSCEGSDSGESYIVKAKSLDDVIDTIQSGNQELLDIDVKKSADGMTATLRFAKWGIKRNHKMTIEPAI